MIRRIGSSHVTFAGSIALMASVGMGCSSNSQPTTLSDAAISIETEVAGESPAALPEDDSSDVEAAGELLAAEATANSPPAVSASQPSKIPEPSTIAAATPRATATKARARPKKKVALAVPPVPEYVYEPTVVMSERDAATCVVGVGDAFPEAQLTDLNNQTVAIKETFGERLTLVVFWSNASRLAREQMQRLPREIVEPFKNTGLGIVAINVGDPPEQTLDILPEEAIDDVSLLLDGEGDLYSKVATERIPRVYLLDPEGKILWLDIEYSRSTVRDLTNAIHVFLGSRVPGDS